MYLAVAVAHILLTFVQESYSEVFSFGDHGLGLGLRRDNMDERGPHFGGDIILNSNQLGNVRSGIIEAQFHWPDGRVPYVLDRGFTRRERHVVRSAILEIQKKTCVRFFPARHQPDYVNITRGFPGSGCYSSVGRQGGGQILNLDYLGCITKGIVAHELMHALGFFHEQTRTDRDDYVTVIFGNIARGRESNFEKYGSNIVNPFGVTYDYKSVMHYSAYAFSKTGILPTILPKKPGITRWVLGQRRGLSPRDAKKVNNMYQGCKNRFE